MNWFRADLGAILAGKKARLAVLERFIAQAEKGGGISSYYLDQQLDLVAEIAELEFRTKPPAYTAPSMQL